MKVLAALFLIAFLYKGAEVYAYQDAQGWHLVFSEVC